jgi:dTMP kinase
MIISFEGLDGAGKTTQATRLAQRLTDAGREVTMLRLFRNDDVESMLGRLDETVGVDNRSARTAVLAKVVARDEWLVRRSHEAGAVIIYDKFLLTMYAQELLRGGRTEEFTAAAEFVSPPDVVFVFTVDPDEALRRKGKPGYRESGLDLQEAAGEIDWNRFVAGDYDEAWLLENFRGFQRRLAETLSQAANDEYVREHIARTPAVHFVPTGISIEETTAFVEKVLADTAVGADIAASR